MYGLEEQESIKILLKESVFLEMKLKKQFSENNLKYFTQNWKPPQLCSAKNSQVNRTSLLNMKCGFLQENLVIIMEMRCCAFF